MHETTPPRWDLTNIYSSLNAPELPHDIQVLDKLLTGADSFLKKLPRRPAQASAAQLSKSANELLDRYNAILILQGKINNYLESYVSTDSYNDQALRIQSEFELVMVRAQQLDTRISSWLGLAGSRLKDVVSQGGSAASHSFYMKEAAEQSKYLMKPELEDLASELSLSGANAWNKLQGTLTSQLKVDFELDGVVQSLPMPALINLHSHPNETVRRRAYQSELAAWETVKVPLAAAMNGVKGAANTLNQHRGRTDALHSAIDMARMDRETLNTMLSAMQDSFPMFGRYFKAKAHRLGKDKLPWWDVFAPTGQARSSYSFSQARDFIIENFESFSPDLAQFARKAFDRNWIDAEQRSGKRGGAFCIGIDALKESRILCNFDGSLDQVSTIAHELGHGFHNECMYQANKTVLQSNTPMTLAETASIMCETIVINAALEQTKDPQEELAILETRLVGDAQVIVDIYSRYLFEKEVFERRANAELSPDELNEIMESAQKATYGDGLDERYLHKFMWTWKPHYYFTGLPFYNFPYAFGLLFATGLYAIYQQRGPAFVADYKTLLASTGEGTAAELASHFGINIKSREFWDGSLQVIGKYIDRYTQL